MSLSERCQNCGMVNFGTCVPQYRLANGSVFALCDVCVTTFSHLITSRAEPSGLGGSAYADTLAGALGYYSQQPASSSATYLWQQQLQQQHQQQQLASTLQAAQASQQAAALNDNFAMAYVNEMRAMAAGGDPAYQNAAMLLQQMDNPSYAAMAYANGVEAMRWAAQYDAYMEQMDDQSSRTSPWANENAKFR